MNVRNVALGFSLLVAILYFDLVMQLNESVNALVWSNETLKLVTVAQHKDIKKCLSKLPEKDVKAFFEENRKEFYQRLIP